MMYSYRAVQEELAGQLITHLLGFKPGEPNFNQSLQYACSNLYHHTCLSPESRQVKSQVDGILLKLSVHGLEDHRNRLQALTEKWIIGNVTSEQGEVRWAVLSLLLQLSHSPTNYTPNPAEANLQHSVNKTLKQNEATADVSEDLVQQLLEERVPLAQFNQEDALSDWSNDDSDSAEDSVECCRAVLQKQKRLSVRRRARVVVQQPTVLGVGSSVHPAAASTKATLKSLLHNATRAQQWLWEHTEQPRYDRSGCRVVSERALVREVLLALLWSDAAPSLGDPCPATDTLPQASVRSLLLPLRTLQQQLCFMSSTAGERQYGAGLRRWLQHTRQQLLALLESVLDADQGSATMVWLLASLEPFVMSVSTVHTTLSALQGEEDATDLCHLRLLGALLEGVDCAATSSERSTLLQLLMHALQPLLQHLNSATAPLQSPTELVYRQPSIAVRSAEFWNMAYKEPPQRRDSVRRIRGITLLLPTLETISNVVKHHQFLSALEEESEAVTSEHTAPTTDQHMSTDTRYLEEDGDVCVLESVLCYVQQHAVAATQAERQGGRPSNEEDTEYYCDHLKYGDHCDDKLKHCFQNTDSQGEHAVKIAENGFAKRDCQVDKTIKGTDNCNGQVFSYSNVRTDTSDVMGNNHFTTLYDANDRLLRMTQEEEKTDDVETSYAAIERRISSLHAPHPVSVRILCEVLQRGCQVRLRTLSAAVMDRLYSTHRFKEHLLALCSVMLLKPTNIMSGFTSIIFDKCFTQQKLNAADLTLELHDCVEKLYPGIAEHFVVAVRRRTTDKRTEDCADAHAGAHADAHADAHTAPGDQADLPAAAPWTKLFDEEELKELNLEHIGDLETEVMADLHVEYRAQWPLNVLVSEQLLRQYEAVLHFCLRLQQAMHMLHSLHFSDMSGWEVVECDSPPCNASSVRSDAPLAWRLHRLQLLRHWLLYYCRCLHDHFTACVIMPFYERLHRLLQCRPSLDRLIEEHNSLVTELCRQCLLSPGSGRDSPVQLALKQVLAVVREVGSVWRCGGASPDHLARLESSYASCHRFLLRLLETLAGSSAAAAKTLQHLSGLIASLTGSCPVTV